MSFILVELGYSLVCSPIVCYLKERMANGDVAFYCNRHHCVDWTWNKNSWLTWNRITKSICILKWNTCEAHVSNRKEYGNGQSVKTVGRQWWPEERQGKDCKGAQKIHLKVKVGVGKKVKVERGHKPENNHLWWGQWPTWGIIHTEANVTQIRRKLRDAERIQMIFAHQVVTAHC